LLINGLTVLPYDGKAALWHGEQRARLEAKGLRQFFETGSTAGIQAPLARKLRLQLAALHSATQIEDMDLPG
jgi:proteic killer suppression protein